MDETIILFFFLKKGKSGGSIDRLYPDFCKANAWPVFCTESNSSKTLSQDQEHYRTSLWILDSREGKWSCHSWVPFWKVIVHGMTLPQPSLGSKEFSIVPTCHSLWGHKWDKEGRNTVVYHLSQSPPGAAKLATSRMMPQRLTLGCRAPKSNESPCLPAQWPFQGYISLILALLRCFEPSAVEIDDSL